MALKVGRMVVFTALATAAGHVFSLSMQSNDPTKLRIFFGISSLPPCFFEVEESKRGNFLLSRRKW